MINEFTSTKKTGLKNTCFTVILVKLISIHSELKIVENCYCFIVNNQMSKTENKYNQS